jgi:peptidyl-dipeptidase Dcp
MAQQLTEIAAIAGNKIEPTFDNTIAAMERSGRMLDRVNSAFFGVVQANTNPALDKVQTVEAPKLAAYVGGAAILVGLFVALHSGSAATDARATQAIGALAEPEI